MSNSSHLRLTCHCKKFVDMVTKEAPEDVQMKIFKFHRSQMEILAKLLMNQACLIEGGPLSGLVAVAVGKCISKKQEYSIVELKVNGSTMWYEIPPGYVNICQYVSGNPVLVENQDGKYRGWFVKWTPSGEAKGTMSPKLVNILNGNWVISNLF